MISYLGSLVQFSPAAGRAGRCRQMPPCVGSTRRALARQPAVLAPSPRVLRAFLSVASGQGSQRFACALPGRGAPFPSAAPACAAGGVSGSLYTGTGACLPSKTMDCFSGRLISAASDQKLFCLVNS